MEEPVTDEAMHSQIALAFQFGWVTSIPILIVLREDANEGRMIHQALLIYNGEVLAI